MMIWLVSSNGAGLVTGITKVVVSSFKPGAMEVVYKYQMEWHPALRDNTRLF